MNAFFGSFFHQVNDKDMKGVTREEAVLFLLNLNDQIELVVQHRKQEFDYILSNQIGDNFYIRCGTISGLIST